MTAAVDAWFLALAVGLARSRQRRPARSLGRKQAARLAAGSWLLGGVAMLLGHAESRYLDRVNRQIAPPTSDPEERLHRTVQYVYACREPLDVQRIESPLFRLVARVEAASPLHVSARTTITGGADHGGPCGSMSRAVQVLLSRGGIEARKLFLYDEHDSPQHTVIEARLRDRWAVVDATYGRIWQRDDDGELLTAEQLAADSPLFERLASTLPNYPTDRFGYRNVFHLRVEKVPGLKRLREPMRAWLGDDFVRSIKTPYIYERPQFLMASALFAIGSIALAVDKFLASNDLL